MICKASNTTLLGGVNILPVSFCSDHNDYIGKAYFFLLQHHEIEMLDAFSGISNHSLAKGLLLHDLANVFVYQCTAAMSAFCSGLDQSGEACLAHAGMSEEARRPKPFFSVRTMSTSPNCRFAKLAISHDLAPSPTGYRSLLTVGSGIASLPGIHVADTR